MTIIMKMLQNGILAAEATPEAAAAIADMMSDAVTGAANYANQAQDLHT